MLVQSKRRSGVLTVTSIPARVGWYPVLPLSPMPLFDRRACLYSQLLHRRHPFRVLSLIFYLFHFFLLHINVFAFVFVYECSGCVVYTSSRLPFNVIGLTRSVFCQLDWRYGCVFAGCIARFTVSQNSFISQTTLRFLSGFTLLRRPTFFLPEFLSTDFPIFSVTRKLSSYGTEMNVSRNDFMSNAETVNQ